MSRNFSGWDIIANKKFGISTGRYFCSEKKTALGIYHSIRIGLNPEKNDIICDLACGSGIYHRMILETGALLFGIDSSKNLIETASFNNPFCVYLNKSILDDSIFYILKSIKPNKVILNSFIHYLSDAEFDILLTNISNIKSVRSILIGDIPLKEMKDRFNQNKSLIRGIKFFFMRFITKLFIGNLLSKLKTRNYTVKMLNDIAISKNFSVTWIKQDRRQQFYNTRADLLLVRQETSE